MDVYHTFSSNGNVGWYIQSFMWKMPHHELICEDFTPSHETYQIVNNRHLSDMSDIDMDET